MAPKGSPYPYFVKRIPAADLRHRLVGRSLIIPLANGKVDFKITPSTQSIRFSLRTANPAEVKVRQAEALAYVEQYLEALRNGRPIQLTHRQITALAGEFYKSWSPGPDVTGSLTLTPSTGEFFTREDDEFDEAEMLSAALQRVGERAAGQDDEYFLKAHGPDIDRMFTAFGVPEITPGSRATLAVAFGKMLLEGLETNARISGGDYSPDPNLNKFPQWEAPSETPMPNHQPGSPVPCRSPRLDPRRRWQLSLPSQLSSPSRAASTLSFGGQACRHQQGEAENRWPIGAFWLPSAIVLRNRIPVVHRL
ncbi:hypothetical protein [Rhizobium sp. R635]|uniref:hypothetical protein n=1 Tax=Rhizobium sp. R635 TaxID=1764275 RepID=UPI0011301B31|nr:hypothetical protein [Rhizobium sp. R635]